MGLAPQLVQEIFDIVQDLNEREGVTFLLAEQNTTVALRYASYGYILETGRVVMDGEAKALAENEDVKEFYLGVSTGGRKSFRDTKSYRRRKRWLSLTEPPGEIDFHHIQDPAGQIRTPAERLQAARCGYGPARVQRGLDPELNCLRHVGIRLFQGCLRQRSTPAGPAPRHRMQSPRPRVRLRIGNLMVVPLHQSRLLSNAVHQAPAQILAWMKKLIWPGLEGWTST